MHRFTKAVSAVAAVAGLVAVPASTSTAATAALAAKVRVVDNDFRPATVTVPVGNAVGWLNRGNSAHTVTFDDGAFDVTLSSGESARRRFNAPGTYHYVCKFHFGMDGEVVVTN